MYIDNIGLYLASLGGTEFDNMQHLKIKLHMEIKIPLGQRYIEPLRPDNMLMNYVKIEQYAKKYYFFIESYEWIGEQSIKLMLLLDTINTFYNDEAFMLSDRNLIHRRLKDRFSVKNVFGNNVILYNVDQYSEGINRTLERVTAPRTVEDTAYTSAFYLVYKNVENQDAFKSTPVSLGIYADSDYNKTFNNPHTYLRLDTLLNIYPDAIISSKILNMVIYGLVEW